HLRAHADPGIGVHWVARSCPQLVPNWSELIEFVELPNNLDGKCLAHRQVLEHAHSSKHHDVSERNHVFSFCLCFVPGRSSTALRTAFAMCSTSSRRSSWCTGNPIVRHRRNAA